MPRNDPNKIDVERALWLYRVIKRDWRFVAAELKRPDGTPYTQAAIRTAVRRHYQRPQQ